MVLLHHSFWSSLTHFQELPDPGSGRYSVWGGNTSVICYDFTIFVWHFGEREWIMVCERAFKLRLLWWGANRYSAWHQCRCPSQHHGKSLRKKPFWWQRCPHAMRNVLVVLLPSPLFRNQDIPYHHSFCFKLIPPHYRANSSRVIKVPVSCSVHAKILHTLRINESFQPQDIKLIIYT